MQFFPKPVSPKGYIVMNSSLNPVRVRLSIVLTIWALICGAAIYARPSIIGDDFVNLVVVAIVGFSLGILRYAVRQPMSEGYGYTKEQLVIAMLCVAVMCCTISFGHSYDALALGVMASGVVWLVLRLSRYGNAELPKPTRQKKRSTEATVESDISIVSRSFEPQPAS